MTDDEFKDRVIELLEIIAFGSGVSGECPHDNTTDIGTMGTKPGERVKCMDCGTIFSRLED